MFRLTGQLALLPYSFAEYQEMGLHQCPDLTVMGLRRSAENLGTIPRFLSLAMSAAPRVTIIPRWPGRGLLAKRNYLLALFVPVPRHLVHLPPTPLPSQTGQGASTNRVPYIGSPRIPLASSDFTGTETTPRLQRLGQRKRPLPPQFVHHGS